MFKKATSLIVSLAFVSIIWAQTDVALQTDIGENQVSNGILYNISGIGTYNQKGNYFGLGLQHSSQSSQSALITDYFINTSKDLTIKNYQLQLGAYFLQSNFSSVLKEFDWGLKAKIKRQHYELTIGNNFRTYAYTQKAQDEYLIEGNSKIHENWNLLYAFTYYLKPIQNKWNVSGTICNFDHFIINQATNPIFNIKGKYEFDIPIELYTELWYKSAGAFNINVNYFGYFLRTGIVWRIE